ncbi:MAG: aerial mycelium formation protein [Actinomycetota bacterium]
MSELVKAGGNRRLDRVLDEAFARNLSALETEKLRERRNLARAEREYLSLVRRLLQGRLDILRAERDRRASGGDAASIRDRLPEILADAPRGPSRGEAVVVPMPDEEISLARRRVERLVSDTSLSDLEALSDADLGASIGRLEEEERAVSDVRGKVLAVLDQLQGELKERLRAEYGGVE